MQSCAEAPSLGRAAGSVLGEAASSSITAGFSRNTPRSRSFGRQPGPSFAALVKTELGHEMPLTVRPGVSDAKELVPEIYSGIPSTNRPGVSDARPRNHERPALVRWPSICSVGHEGLEHSVWCGIRRIGARS